MKKTKEELQEQKKQYVLEAIECVKRANAEWEQAEKLFNKAGIELCSVKQKDYYYDTSVHVFSGIKKLAELFDFKPIHPLDIFGDEIKNERAVVIDDTLLFQLGEARDKNYCYR